jgi:hypothetical protein
MRQSWLVGRDSVEPKLDSLGKSHDSTELPYLSPPSLTHYGNPVILLDSSVATSSLLEQCRGHRQ